MNAVVTDPKQVRKPPQEANPGIWRALERVAGLFLIAVGLVMSLDYVSARREDPLDSPQLKALKDELRAAPTSEQIKLKIRNLDLELRERHFRHISRMTSGVWLLLGSGGLLLFSAARSRPSAQSFDFLKTRPDTTASAGRRVKTAALWAVGSSGIAAAVFLTWLVVGSATPALPARVAQVDRLLSGESENAVPDYAPVSELDRNWTRFRGPGGNGVDLAGKAPTSWDAQSGASIAWKVLSPVQGFNSPLVFGDHVFFSGGDASKLEVICLRLSNGQLAWRQALEAPSPSGAPVEVPESTGYAPSTMATDGRRVYAIFANGVVGAVTLDGKVVWTKSFGSLSNPYGHAISLATWRNRLLIQLDQGESGEGKSVLYMLDGRSGRPVWQKPRTLGASWATPIIIDAAGKQQIITLSIPMVIAYSAANGDELWRIDCLNGEVTPSPVFAGGRLIVASPSDRIMSIRPDGQGDVTKTHIEWSFDEDIPDVTSPVSNGELLFFVTTSGTVTCVDLKDGKKLWSHDWSFECHASPGISGNLLYQFGQDGSVVIAEAAREYKEVFKTTVPDSFHASPAFVQDSIVVRGISNIWRFGPVSSPVAKGGSDK